MTGITSAVEDLILFSFTFKSMYTFLTLFYINSLSIFFITSFYFDYFLSVFLHPLKTVCRKHLCLVVPCVSSYRWVHFSRAVLSHFQCLWPAAFAEKKFILTLRVAAGGACLFLKMRLVVEHLTVGWPSEWRTTFQLPLIFVWTILGSKCLAAKLPS